MGKKSLPGQVTGHSDTGPWSHRTMPSDSSAQPPLVCCSHHSSHRTVWLLGTVWGDCCPLCYELGRAVLGTEGNYLSLENNWNMFTSFMLWNTEFRTHSFMNACLWWSSFFNSFNNEWQCLMPILTSTLMRSENKNWITPYCAVSLQTANWM